MPIDATDHVRDWTAEERRARAAAMQARRLDRSRTAGSEVAGDRGGQGGYARSDDGFGADSGGLTVLVDRAEHLLIYVDGACVGNPGPGGIGIVVLCGDRRWEYASGYRWTTNNRMELLAAITALAALDGPAKVTLRSDSRYVVDGISRGWARGWRKRGWRHRKGPVPNADLWQRLLELCARHDVAFEWVRGHAGDRENERCDEFAEAAARGSNLGPDEGYESPGLDRARLLRALDPADRRALRRWL